ncbi:MAG: signal peptidase I [Rhabdochlamydiaceae bacterium]|jgi:signal peptidase I
MKIYSLRKSRHVLRQAVHRFRKKKKGLSPENRTLLTEALAALQKEIMNGDREKADALAKQIESLGDVHLKKRSWDHLKELVCALAFALIVAILVRQMWFEFYEIPSGSMRPTLKEQDRLVVTKTDFGINIPLRPAEFYFDPDLVQRNSIVIFTGENMDIRDVDTMYFYIFPGKKQYIKRMIGKPGDVLYFYGGEIYGIDADGHDISSLLQIDRLKTIDHIPFIDFDRKLYIPPNPINGIYSPVFIYQMNEPVVKLSVASNGLVHGEMVVPPQIHSSGAPPVVDYGDLWGFKNYGMGRLLTRDQVKNLSDQNPSTMEEGLLYLEIRHHPSLTNVKLIRDELGKLRPSIGLSTSIVPLQENHLKAIFQNMYTARFIVKNGLVYRYGMDPKVSTGTIFFPHLNDVPDGCYEFYEGKAYEIKWQGITKELPPSHSLYRFDPAKVQLFFNLGIEWDTRFSPHIKNQRLVPARYAYFRNGDLYLLGAPILLQSDPTLQSFLQRENLRRDTSNPQALYQPFEDLGPPLSKDGSLNFATIRQNGILVPPKMYLVLGDNHAMSADSRDFGFVPESNLRGGPELIFWPPGPRWGIPNQLPYPFINFPRLIVWLIAAVGIGAGYLYWRKRNHLPLKIE